MMKKLGTVALLSMAAGAFAQSTPQGVWKTIDDKTKSEKAQVRITETAGVFSAKIEKLLTADTKQDAVCDLCTDDRKDKPIMGMEIMRGVKKSDKDNLWSGGTILDPAEGKVYKVRLQTAEGGKKLEVRGYFGMPMIGRTQTWVRVD